MITGYAHPEVLVEADRALQELMVKQSASGMVLAICSKNPAARCLTVVNDSSSTRPTRCRSLRRQLSEP